MNRFIRWLAVSQFFALQFLTLPAAADVPPPPPKFGFKRVPYVNALILKADLPDYRFYTFERMGLGGSETVGKELKLSTETSTTVPSSSSPSVRTGVVAVPAKMMDELGSTEKLADLLSVDKDLPTGVAVYETYGTIRDVKKSDPRAKVENIVTVSQAADSSIRFTAEETPAPTGDGDGDGEATPPAMLIAGIAAAMAVAALGLRYFRASGGVKPAKADPGIHQT